MLTVVLLVLAIGCTIASLIGRGYVAKNLKEAQKIVDNNDSEWQEREAAKDVVRSAKPLVGPLSVTTAILAIVSLALAAFSCIYTQDAGDVIVLRNISGAVDGMTKDAGFHTKLPWQETVTYDQRNNVISFVGDGEEDYTGGSANGPDVTVNDSGGAAADIDIQVNYSLDPNYAMDLYRDYGTQETFVRSVVAVDVRNRGEFAQAVEGALSAKWADMGLIIEQVSVQDVRYNEGIEEKYNQAQEAEVAKQQALNEQETAKVQAETRRIEAEGQAEANRTLQESLSDEVASRSLSWCHKART